MTIRELIISEDGTSEIRERELSPEEEAAMFPPPEPEEPDEQAATDSILVDHEYRLIMLELGINEMEV